ncbi:Pancreatic triacylglycerol lipase [Papilio machaon]|uniref:Pancreatic triacylglycerol lipase n=1 Tax=Papilio machaon TaxID=76193 RepID=A0A194RCX9_PAPMA|nr:Pancreatic triacylglycerol lipase [Papilio machaon]
MLAQYDLVHMENHISPEDLEEFLNWHHKKHNGTDTSTDDYGSMEPVTDFPESEEVDCFGLGSFASQLINMRPDTSENINTHFYFSSRQNPNRVQVFPGDQFGLEWVDFKPNRRTIMIVHGFMSHSNASWVTAMTNAFLQWGDVNVIAVDWSQGGNTWKYWRAVANTRTVGGDVTGFMQQLMKETGANAKDFHFVGHSLGAHIVSYVSYHLGRVSRITGLDPAQPCFRTNNLVERLDSTDADFVDVIHTNGRLLSKIGFGFPDPTGHADFYPNGGMKQPGCFNTTSSLWARLLPIPVGILQQAVCSHGRAYLLFIESLVNNNCSFRGHQWNLTYEGVNASIVAACDRVGACSEMGIRAIGGNGLPRATGAYFVLTTATEPYCPTDWERRHPQPELLRDLREGFRLDRSVKAVVTDTYADPMATKPPPAKSTFFSWWQTSKRPHEFAETFTIADALPTANRRRRRRTKREYLTFLCISSSIKSTSPSHPKDKDKTTKIRPPVPHSSDEMRNCFHLTPVFCVDVVHKQCEELITDCSFNHKQFRCCDKFFPVDSESGPGISFNSLQHMENDHDKLFNVNQSTGPGVLTFRLLSDAQISIHSPEELSTKLLDNKFKIDVDLNYHNHVDILFSIVEVENDPLLQFETPNVRGCRYLEEVPNGFMHTYPVYSNGACRLARNTERSYQQCGCVHPVRDISCEKVKLGVDKGNNDSCLPSCVESELTIVHTSMRRVPKQAKRGSLINISMISLPTLRYRKNLLRNDLDLVVTVGGMLGLFFSASVLSLAEAIYLIIRQPNKELLLFTLSIKL